MVKILTCIIVCFFPSQVIETTYLTLFDLRARCLLKVCTFTSGCFHSPHGLILCILYCSLNTRVHVTFAPRANFIYYVLFTQCSCARDGNFDCHYFWPVTTTFGVTIKSNCISWRRVPRVQLYYTMQITLSGRFQVCCRLLTIELDFFKRTHVKPTIEPV